MMTETVTSLITGGGGGGGEGGGGQCTMVGIEMNFLINISLWR